MAENGRNTGLHGFIVDCRTDDLDAAARFWSEALRLKLSPAADSGDAGYRHLEAGPGGLHIEIQKVEHESRVHLDLQAEDVVAEVKRLEGLGAVVFKQVKDWVVMEAPTGHRFCVVPARGRPLPE
jgi:predicted enzyme related to lactoylglutathione lyase